MNRDEAIKRQMFADYMRKAASWNKPNMMRPREYMGDLEPGQTLRRDSQMAMTPDFMRQQAEATGQRPQPASAVKRPVAPAVEPAAPAAVKREVPPGTMAKEPTPTPMVVPANRAPTPKLRGNPGNLPGVNDVKPNPWKNMLREGINQMATPGYFDKDRGVWVSGAHAYGEKKAGKAKENKTIEFLKRKGHSKEDAEAIVAQGPDAIKEYMAAVRAPRRFDKRGFTVSFEGGKAYATDPRTGEVSPAQFNKEELANGSQSALSDEVVKDISGAIGILDDNESGTFSSMFSAGDLFGLGSSYLSADTPYGRLDTALKGVRAQTTVESMKLLRDQSSNGATGLGQITQKELDMLQNMRGSLDTWSSPDQLRATLVELHDFKKWISSGEYRSDGSRNNFEEWRSKNGYKGGSSGGTDDGWSVKVKGE
jgi:hypothetical protein